MGRRYVVVFLDELRMLTEGVLERIHSTQWEELAPGEKERYVHLGQQGLLTRLRTWYGSKTESIYVWSERRAELVRPYVERARQQVFHQSEAPFEDEIDAAEWIDKQAWHHHRWDDEAREKLVQRFFEAQEALNSYLKSTGDYSRYAAGQIELRELHYLGRDGRPARAPATTESAALLKFFSEQLSRYTFWPESISTMHLLSDVIPVIPRLHADMHARLLGRIPTPSRMVTLCVVSPHVSQAELWRKFIESRLRAWSSHIHQLKPEDEAFLELTVELGEPPSGKGRGKNVGLSAYWERARLEWNKRYPGKPYKDWRGLQKRHLRLVKRMEAGKAT